MLLHLQGIAGHGYYDNCVVPIIENTARECELTDRLRQAIKDYPKAQAVLVRRHGVYVWGSSWIQAKTQAECYDYLFEAAIKLKSLGIDASKPSANAPASVTNGILQNGHAQNGHTGELAVLDLTLMTAKVSSFCKVTGYLLNVFATQMHIFGYMMDIN